MSNQFVMDFDRPSQAGLIQFKFDVLKEFKATPLQSEEFSKSVERLDQATKMLSRAFARAGKQLSQLTSNIDQLRPYYRAKRVGKLPRKKKKKYIRIHGRDQYRNKFRYGVMMIQIDSPGGYV